MLTLFPAEIPIDQNRRIHPESEQSGNEQTPHTFKMFCKENLDMVTRLFRNKIYVLHVLGTMFTLNAIVGFLTFLPKYFEYMFRRRASTSVVGPALNSIVSVISLLSTGAIVTKCQLSAREYLIILFIKQKNVSIIKL